MQDTQQCDAVAVFVGVDIGIGQHHAVALDRNGERLYKKALPNDAAKPRALIAELKTHGRLLFIANQPSTIGALPVAVARAEGILVAYLPGLAVKRQEVVSRRGKSGHRRNSSDGAVGTMPVVVMLPACQGIAAVGGALVCPGVCPLAQGRLDETLSLTVGLRTIRPCKFVPDTQ
ncbi:hypothetical protein ABIC51_007138 [Burkholderia sp. 572]